MSTVKTIRSVACHRSRGKKADPHKFPHSVHPNCPDSLNWKYAICALLHQKNISGLYWLNNWQSLFCNLEMGLNNPIYLYWVTFIILVPKNWSAARGSDSGLDTMMHRHSSKTNSAKKSKINTAFMLQSFQENLSLNQQAIDTFNLCDWMRRKSV